MSVFWSKTKCGLLIPCVDGQSPYPHTPYQQNLEPGWIDKIVDFRSSVLIVDYLNKTDKIVDCWFSVLIVNCAPPPGINKIQIWGGLTQLLILCIGGSRGRAQCMPPYGSRFFHFDIQNFWNVTALGFHTPPTRSMPPPLWEILDPPLLCVGYWLPRSGVDWQNLWLLILFVDCQLPTPYTLNTKTALTKWSCFLAQCPTLYHLYCPLSAAY